MVERGYQLISGGTENHLMLIDLRNKSCTGKQAEAALGLAHITINKNMVPFDTASPMVTSGIRLGTAALTTRGMKEADMEPIAGWIDQVIQNHNVKGFAERVGLEVSAFAQSFPLFKA
jgi:glycine hydroxymethyltransferase